MFAFSSYFGCTMLSPFLFFFFSHSFTVADSEVRRRRHISKEIRINRRTEKNAIILTTLTKIFLIFNLITGYQFVIILQ